MDLDRSDFEGACHCGTVRFRVTLSEGLRNLWRCNCSLCRMRGAVVAFAPLADFELLNGQDKLGHYQFNTGTAHHYFCSMCGIYTHHQRRLDPSQYAINTACLEGVSPFDFAEVPVMDGISHPRDNPGESGEGTKGRIAGFIRFEPNV